MIQKLEQYVIGANYGCGGASFSEVIDKINEVIDYINSLPDEDNPEPYNPVYDEDYLNEKIAKATKSWEGVDVNKMLADCRGYEEKPSEDLEEEVKRYYSDNFTYISSDQPTLSILTNVARHFAGWQYQKDRGEFAKIKTKTWCEGFDDHKQQMLKDAVDGEIGYWNQRGLSIRLDQSLEKLGYGEETEVKIIIVKK